MEDSYQDKRSGKLFRICKFLQMVYQEFQLYGKTSQWTQRKKELEMGRRALENTQQTKEQDNKSTSTHSSKEGR